MASFIKQFKCPVTAILKPNSNLYPNYFLGGFLSIPSCIGKWLEYYSTSIRIQRFKKLAYPWWLVPTKQLQKTICNKRTQYFKSAFFHICVMSIWAVIFLTIPLCIQSDWKIFEWIKLLWRHLHQIQETWVGRNFIVLYRVWIHCSLRMQECRWIWNLQLRTDSTLE